MTSKPLKILVVDDEKVMRDMASNVLRSAGHDVATASTGDEALERLDGGFELILTDLDMPGATNGTELTKRSRARTNADVIIMTGYPDLTSAIHAVREGAYDYLVKPFSPDTLKMAVDRCAAKRHLSKELEREKTLREELNRAYIELSQMQKVRDLFGQFTTPEVARFVLEHPDDFWKRGERRDVTILFADVRGFTPYARMVPPEKAVESLNQIFDVLVGAIQDQGGVVNKFLGDGVMGVFGAPQTLDDHAAAAARAATKARAMLRFAMGQAPDADGLHVGFALNTGEVLAGCLGARGRSEYSVIGSAVNLAARIEKVAGPGEIVLGPETAKRVAAFFHLEGRPAVALPGFPEPVDLSLLGEPKPGAFVSVPR